MDIDPDVKDTADLTEEGDVEPKQSSAEESALFYEKVDDYLVKDPYILPSPLRTHCQDKAIYWLERTANHGMSCFIPCYPLYCIESSYWRTFGTKIVYKNS